MADARRSLPSIDTLLGSEPMRSLLEGTARKRLVAILRIIQAKQRDALIRGESVVTSAEWYAGAVREEMAAIDALRTQSLRPVINATGVVLHTNLGRAPLADEAMAAIQTVAAGYSNLEYELDEGTRGSRYDHCTALLRELTGAEDALVVNNNAAALVLVLNTFARDREAIVSRGELVEIGGSFRIPEIMERSGARLREVGATNRTHLSDYAKAITAETTAVLKVHRSNFRMSGFVSEVAIEEMAKLAAEQGLVLLHDLGSGLFVDLTPYGFPHEPMPREVLAAGAHLVTMSGDKLMGGPQAGIIAGAASMVARLRANPLCRAFRVDKLTLAALGATLQLYLEPSTAHERIPALRMLTAGPDAIERRARVLWQQLNDANVPSELRRATSLVGAGAFPDVELPTTVVLVGTVDESAALDRRLRAANPPVITRMLDGRVAVDLRTISEAETPPLLHALVAAR